MTTMVLFYVTITHITVNGSKVAGVFENDKNYFGKSSPVWNSDLRNIGQISRPTNGCQIYRPILGTIETTDRSETLTTFPYATRRFNSCYRTYHWNTTRHVYRQLTCHHVACKRGRGIDQNWTINQYFFHNIIIALRLTGSTKPFYHNTGIHLIFSIWLQSRFSRPLQGLSRQNPSTNSYTTSCKHHCYQYPLTIICPSVLHVAIRTGK